AQEHGDDVAFPNAERFDPRRRAAGVQDQLMLVDMSVGGDDLRGLRPGHCLALRHSSPSALLWIVDRRPATGLDHEMVLPLSQGNGQATIGNPSSGRNMAKWIKSSDF